MDLYLCVLSTYALLVPVHSFCYSLFHLTTFKPRFNKMFSFCCWIFRCTKYNKSKCLNFQFFNSWNYCPGGGGEILFNLDWLFWLYYSGIPKPNSLCFLGPEKSFQPTFISIVYYLKSDQRLQMLWSRLFFGEIDLCQILMSYASST